MSSQLLLLLFKDGTGNSPETDFPDGESGRGFTNIYKLHLLAGGSTDRTDEKDYEAGSNYVDGQISLYQRGVAASRQENFRIPGLTKLAKLQSLVAAKNFAVGNVMRFQVNPMIDRISKVYDEGDSVYVIGFSRGAASARIFTNKILTGEKGFKVPSVEFLGVYDTVLEDQLINLGQKTDFRGFRTPFMIS